MKRPEAPDLRTVLRALTRELEQAEIESPAVEAERLVAHATGVERPRLALEAGSSLSADAAIKLTRLVERRLGGEPLQHLEGSTQFRSLVLSADSRALIPRPETEQLVGLIKRWVRDRSTTREAIRTVMRPGARRDFEPVPTALDIGTGSGAIALSMAGEGIARSVIGVDASAEALEQACENREAAGLTELVEFRLVISDPFQALHSGEAFSLIVANPPYVTDRELADLPREIREFEPIQALSGGEDGLDLLRLIAARAYEYLEESGALFLETGSEQTGAVSDLLSSSGRWEQITVRRDLAGRFRFVTAMRA